MRAPTVSGAIGRVVGAMLIQPLEQMTTEALRTEYAELQATTRLSAGRFTRACRGWLASEDIAAGDSPSTGRAAAWVRAARWVATFSS